MAKIPRQYRQEDVSLEGAGANRASGEVFGSGVGDSIQNLGRGASDIGERIRIDREADSILHADKTFSDLELRYKTELLQKEKTSSGDISGFREDLLGRYKQEVSNLMQTMPTKNGRNRFDRLTSGLGADLDLNSNALEIARAKEGAYLTSRDTVKNKLAIVATDPSQENFDKSIQLINDNAAVMAARGIPAEVIAHDKQDDLKTVAETQISSVARMYGPETALKRLKSGAYTGMLDADQIAAKAAWLQGQTEQRNAWEVQQANKDTETAISDLRRTGNSSTTPEAIAARLGGDANQQKANVEKVSGLFESAKMDYTDSQNYIGRSPDQRAAYFAKRRSEVSSYSGPLSKLDLEDQIAKSEAQSKTDLENQQKHPASYFTANDPNSRQSYGAFLDAVDKKSPDAPMLFQKYADNLRAAQVAAGFRPDEVQLVPDQYALDTVKDITSQSTNPEQALNKMRGLKALWGDNNFNDVMRQLENLPGTSKLPGNYDLVMRRMDRPYINNLLNILRTDPKDVKALFPDEKSQAAIKTQLRTNPAVVAWLATNPAHPADDLEAADQYAMALEAGGNPGRGAQMAANDLFNSEYAFKKEPNGQISIPKAGYTDNEILNVKDSLDNMKEVIASQPMEKFNPVQVALLTGTTVKEEQAAKWKELIANGSWRNDGPDKGALWLHYPVGGGAAPLVDGSPNPQVFRIKFDDYRNTSWPVDANQWAENKGLIFPTLFKSQRDWVRVSK